VPPRGEDGYEVALLDWLSCAAAGTAEPAARAARAVGNGLVERVAAAGAAGHALDYDDTYLPGVAHLSAATAPAALLVAAEQGLSAGAALEAFAAGFEAMGALARASHPALYDGGWHPTSVCGGPGAAVASARLLGLGPEEERSAIALALTAAGGLRASFGSDGKPIQVGRAAANGVAAATLAAAGARAPLERVAGGPAGFEAAFGAAFGAAGGAGPAIEENWIKAYPCCLQTHGAIEAALSVREADGGDAGEWRDGLAVAVHRLSLQAAPVEIPGDGLEAKFSIPYLTAFALLHGAPAPSDFARVDETAASLAERITVRADSGLDESEAVLLSGGRELARVRAARGSPSRPLDARALAAKRRSLAGERLEGALEDRGAPAAGLLMAAGLA
jgi:2-methylcitrate dehydratase PrpD